MFIVYGSKTIRHIFRPSYGFKPLIVRFERMDIINAQLHQVFVIYVFVYDLTIATSSFCYYFKYFRSEAAVISSKAAAVTATFKNFTHDPSIRWAKQTKSERECARLENELRTILIEKTRAKSDFKPNKRSHLFDF